MTNSIFAEALRREAERPPKVTSDPAPYWPREASAAWRQGREFAEARGTLHMLDDTKSHPAGNPYPVGSDDHEDWRRGVLNREPLLRLRKA